MSRLPCDLVYDSDGFIIHLRNPDKIPPPPPDDDYDFVDQAHDSGHIDPARDSAESSSFNERTYHSTNNERRTVMERPVSRHSNYRSEKRRRIQSPPRPPPLRVRRYSFVLDGYPGLYTIAQISRYVDFGPRRGTAMLLRRFCLINEVLDRRHAVDYQSRWIFPEPSDGSGSYNNSNPLRWRSHGNSKLRNELSVADFAADDSIEEMPSFDPPSGYSFNSELSNDSLEFEAPMKNISSVSDSSEETSFDASSHNILDASLICTRGSLVDSTSEVTNRTRAILQPATGANVNSAHSEANSR